MVGSEHRTSLHIGRQALEARLIVGNSDTSMALVSLVCPSAFQTVTVVRNIAFLGFGQQ